MPSLVTLLAVSSIAPPVKKPDHRPALNNVYITRESITANNGHSLIQVEEDCSGLLGNLESLLLPCSVIEKLSKKVRGKLRRFPTFVEVMDTDKALLTLGCLGEDETFTADFSVKYPDACKAISGIKKAKMDLPLDYLLNMEYGAALQKAFNTITGKVEPQPYWRIKPTWVGILYEYENVTGIIMPINRKP